MPLETLEIETGAAPQASIILMHGLGADCHDFEPLAQQLDLSRAGPVSMSRTKDWSILSLSTASRLR